MSILMINLLGHRRISKNINLHNVIETQNDDSTGSVTRAIHI